MLSLGKILLPIDFSERCLQARHAAPSLAKRVDLNVAFAADDFLARVMPLEAPVRSFALTH